jgi:short-subunit dehydrogenase
MEKTVLVTGASSGIGRCTARKLLKQGYIVYGAARRAGRMIDLEGLGGHVLRMDVTDQAQVSAGVARMIREQGRIDVLLNNAGYGSYGNIEDVPIEEQKRQLDVNLFGQIRVLKSVLPQMRKQGSGLIISMSSMVGQFSTPITGWYGVSKRAVEAYTDSLRLEVSDLGIKVVKIQPGALKTEFSRIAFENLDKIKCAPEYKPLEKSFRKYSTDLYNNCEGPEKTADLIVKVIQSRNPHPSYLTTWEAKKDVFLRKILGERLFYKIVHSKINPNSKK